MIAEVRRNDTEKREERKNQTEDIETKENENIEEKSAEVMELDVVEPVKES